MPNYEMLTTPNLRALALRCVADMLHTMTKAEMAALVTLLQGA